MTRPSWLAAAGCLAACSAETPATPAPVPVPPSDAGAGDAAAIDAGDLRGARPVFVGFWGGFGLAPGQFVEPSSVELAASGEVYVAGHENRLQKFDAEGRLLEIWSTAGAGDGQFNHPHGLAVDRRHQDLVYVGDQENHRLQVFDRAGGFVRSWGDAKFKHIHDIGIDPASGEIYSGDYELHLVRKWSPTGALIWEIGGLGAAPGQFNGVWGISTDSRGDVYVADTFNHRVQKLDASGRFLLAWGEFTKPTGVFVDGNDVVYVCDSLGQTINLFDTEGTPIDRWDLREIFGGESEPEDIVIDAAGTHLYVAEVRFHRVLHFVRQ